MRIVQEVSLISVGSFEESNDWSIIRAEIRDAISLIVHPPGILLELWQPFKQTLLCHVQLDLRKVGQSCFVV